MISAQALQQAQRETQAYARHHGTSGRIGKTGRRVRSIHPTAFKNAIMQNGVEVRKDQEYWKDMERRHPEISVKYQNESFVGGAGEGGTVRNRFGRVKERIIFRDGQKIVESFDV